MLPVYLSSLEDVSEFHKGIARQILPVLVDTSLTSNWKN